MIKKEAGEYVPRATSDALCWSCAYCTNGALCCWADGEERTDWIVRQEYGGITVVKCARYKADWVIVSGYTLSVLIHAGKKGAYRYKTNKLIEKAKANGYLLKVEKEHGRRAFYIRKAEE